MPQKSSLALISDHFLRAYIVIVGREWMYQMVAAFQFQSVQFGTFWRVCSIFLSTNWKFAKITIVALGRVRVKVTKLLTCQQTVFPVVLQKKNYSWFGQNILTELLMKWININVKLFVDRQVRILWTLDRVLWQNNREARSQGQVQGQGQRGTWSKDEYLWE